jgi:molybdopterin-guanine dinucleotide biosynthesis protein A
MVSALVLAGGYSTRFPDGDKALATLDGEPLVARVVDRLADTVDEVVVNCRADQRAAIADALGDRAYRVAIDPVPDRGPVAGIRTGCRVASGRWTFVTACDMPFVDGDLAATLLDAAAGDGAIAHVGGHRQPLAAVYRTDRAVAAADTTLSTGSRALTDMLGHLSLAAVTDPVDPECVTDVDTTADLHTVRARSS